MITRRGRFFKMGCSIKRDRKVWRISGFTGAHRYDMIIMLSGSQEPLFFVSGEVKIQSIHTNKSYIILHKNN